MSTSTTADEQDEKRTDEPACPGDAPDVTDMGELTPVVVATDDARAGIPTDDEAGDGPVDAPDPGTAGGEQRSGEGFAPLQGIDEVSLTLPAGDVADIIAGEVSAELRREIVAQLLGRRGET